MTSEFLTKGFSFGEESPNNKSLYYRETSNHWETVSMWFAVFILSVFPLLGGTSSYYNITESKYYYFTIATVAFFILVGFVELSYFLDKPLGAKRFSCGIQRIDLVQIIAGFYLLSSCISSILSGYVKETLVGVTRFEGLITILMYTLIFIFLSFWGEYHDMYIWFTAISVTIFGIISVLEICGIDFISPDGLSYADHQFIGTMGNIDMVGAYVSIVVPLLAAAYVILEGKMRYVCLAGIELALYLQFFIDVDSSKIGLLAFLAITTPFLVCNKKRLARFIMVFSMAALAFGMNKLLHPTGTSVSVSFSKTGIICVIIAVVLAGISLLLEKSKFEFKLSEVKVEIIVAVLIVLCIIAGIIFVYGYTGDILLIKEASEILHGHLSDTAGTNRGLIWKNTWKEIVKKPIFGGGPGVFVYIYTENEEIYAGTKAGALTDFAHNDFLQVAACQGFVGLGFYLAFIFTLFFKSIKVANKNPLVIIFIASCVSYLAHSFFSFSIAIITPLFWVIAGLLDKCVRQSLPQDLKFKEKYNIDSKMQKKAKK